MANAFHTVLTRRERQIMDILYRCCRAAALFASLAAFPLIRAHAQSAPATTTPTRPAFEAASVKIDHSRVPGGASSIRPGGGFTATNETLLQLIRAAYGLETFRILGGPNWLSDERFDVQAQTDREVPREQVEVMLQGLLEERFRLVARADTRDLPIYALVMRAKAGARLRPASPGACSNRVPFANVPAGERPSCGVLSAGPGRMSGRSVTMGLLATQLSARVNRVVVDRTGHPEVFDLDLAWTPDDPTQNTIGAPSTTPDSPPGIFTAIQEQLGLKLESTRGPVEVLVIDSVEHPTAD